MIANKGNQKMSIEILGFDSALSPPDLSFFSNGTQIQHSSELISDLASDEWLQGFGSLQSYCTGIELDLYNEPEFSLEAMAKGVDTLCPTKAEEINDYLDSTAFLSPVSIDSRSPQRTDEIDDQLEQTLDFSTDFDVEELNNTSAMSILEEILSSTHSSDCEESSDHCFDDLNIQCVTEVAKEPKEQQMFESISIETKRSSKRRQIKRKVDETVSRLPQKKSNKRAKTSPNEKKERKRHQNKSAANRYRLKKRAELESIDEVMDKISDKNESLKAQLQKLQVEFKVLFPLAKTAFASVPNKALELQMLDIRVLNHNLLD